MKEFDWLGYCTSCNIGCCHNDDKTIPENQCAKPESEKRYMISDSSSSLLDSMNNVSINKPDIGESYDHRPLECRLFPFDIREINEKLVWVLQDQCHATPKLDYGKFIKFFEGHFSRGIPLNQIKKYVEHNKIGLENYSAENHSRNNFVILREVNWPNE